MVTTKITELDKAYFAGLFDGEGSVHIDKASGERKSKSFILRVEFGVTYKQVLVDMQKIFNAGYINKKDMEKIKNTDSVKRLCESKGCSPNNWKQYYQYRLSGWDARCFLKLIEPFCREKKEQARIAIEYEDGKKSRCNSEHETKRSEFYRLKLQKMKKELIDDNEEDIIFKSDQQTLVIN